MEEFNTVNHIDPIERNTTDHYYKSMISFSHIMGSVTSIVVEYLYSIFDKNFIKTVFNTAEVPYVQRSRQLKNILAKPKPMLIIDPRFDPSDEANFRPQSEFDSWISNDPQDQIKYSLRNACQIIRGDNYALYYHPRRYKMTFAVSLVFDSHMQMLQCQEYMRQSIRHKSQIVGYRYLENIIPDSYMKAIASMNDKDYTSDEFIEWINKYSTIPITKRIRTGSGNYEFFATERTPIEMVFIDGPASNGPIKKGNIEISASLSESINIEFVAFSSVALHTNSEFGEDLPVDTSMEADETIKAVGQVVTEYPEIKTTDSDYLKYQTITLQADINGETGEVMLFDYINNKELEEVIKMKTDAQQPIDFVKVDVYKGVNLFAPSEYTFNSTTFKLTIPNMDAYTVYYVAIYIKANVIGSAKEDTFKTDNFNDIHS